MEKKYDVRAELIDEVINSQKNIKKLEKSLKEPTSTQEEELINSIINAEKEKLVSLEKQKELVSNELLEKKERYEKQNDRIYKAIDKILDEKKYFQNLINISENSILSEKDDDGKYKDAIQENRARKIDELDNKFIKLSEKLEKNTKYIEEIDRTLFMLGVQQNTTNKEENIDNNKNENKTDETKQVDIAKEGKNILNDLSNDYVHTHITTQTKLEKNTKINYKEKEQSPEEDTQNVNNKKIIAEEAQDKPNKKAEETQNNNEHNIKNEADKILTNLSNDYAHVYLNENPSFDRTQKVEIDKEQFKKENIFKRIFGRIKTSKIAKNVTKFFRNLKNKTKLLTSGKENEKEEPIKTEIKRVDSKKPVCERVNVGNVIEVMNKAVDKKYEKNIEKKDREENSKEDEEDELTL